MKRYISGIATAALLLAPVSALAQVYYDYAGYTAPQSYWCNGYYSYSPCYNSGYNYNYTYAPVSYQPTYQYWCNGYYSYSPCVREYYYSAPSYAYNPPAYDYGYPSYGYGLNFGISFGW